MSVSQLRSHPNIKKAIRAKATIAPTAAEHMYRGGYPMSWDEFIGQDRAKKQLRIAAQAAKMRGTPLPHTLIADGAQGIGKTSLAFLAAKDMAAHVKLATGKIKAAEARLLLSGMADGDVLVIDEVHQLVQNSKRDAEWLLHYLQDGVLVGPLGPEEVPRVTIIACTTDPGRLPETILDRFKLRPALERYNERQGTEIAISMAHRIFERPLRMPTQENCRCISAASNNNPRVMRSLLETLRDLTLVSEGANFKGRKGYNLAEVLDWYGLTDDGLTTVAQRYMVALVEDFHGEPAGSSALQDRLQEPGGLVAVERVLVDKGYLKRIKQGRMLTQTGIARARALGAVA